MKDIQIKPLILTLMALVAGCGQSPEEYSSADANISAADAMMLDAEMAADALGETPTNQGRKTVDASEIGEN